MYIYHVSKYAILTFCDFDIYFDNFAIFDSNRAFPGYASVYLLVLSYTPDTNKLFIPLRLSCIDSILD